jgi:hypothetical protein
MTKSDTFIVDSKKGVDPKISLERPSTIVAFEEEKTRPVQKEERKEPISKTSLTDL